LTDEPFQGELLPLEHRSLQQRRLKNHGHVNAEAIYAGQWKALNRQYHDRLLGLLLAPDDGPRDPLTREVLPVSVSRRDAAVAASIIQWLGTNVGRGFVQGCERVVQEANRLRLEIGVRRANLRARSEDQRTPLQRRKARLDAARKRLADATRR
jgi:hypothetical protein